MQKQFCENCEEEVEYVVSEKTMTGTFHGKKYRYNGLEARCKQCNAVIYVPEVMDANLEKLADISIN